MIKGTVKVCESVMVVSCMSVFVKKPNLVPSSIQPPKGMHCPTAIHKRLRPYLLSVFLIH